MTTRSVWLALLLAPACSGSGKDGSTPEHEPAPFGLRFQATADGEPVSCDAPFGGVGPAGEHEIGLSDLRFYVSELVFLDADGAEVETTFDEDGFQYAGNAGWVAMVDLTSNATGSCAATSISFSEGTERTHDTITGTTHLDEVVAVRFEVGVPQALMQEVIAANTAEAAPSPLDEMFWSWNTGYRHFVLNMTVSDGVDDGEGYVHVGSTDCSGTGYLALEDRDACGFVNTPKVELADFDLAADVVAVDLARVLDGLDLLSPIYDEEFNVIGEQPGAECHSMQMQADCPAVFENLGLDLGTGAASAAANTVFGEG